MGDVSFEDMLKKLLQRDKITSYKEKAEAGDEFAQMLLGDIYFYGIHADGQYFTEVERLKFLAEYKNLKTYGLCVLCDRVPDFAEALRWYRMAALKGNEKAVKKIKAIEEMSAETKCKEKEISYRNQFFTRK